MTCRLSGISACRILFISLLLSAALLAAGWIFAPSTTHNGLASHISRILSRTGGWSGGVIFIAAIIAGRRFAESKRQRISMTVCVFMALAEFLLWFIGPY